MCFTYVAQFQLLNQNAVTISFFDSSLAKVKAMPDKEMTDKWLGCLAISPRSFFHLDGIFLVRSQVSSNL